MSYNINSAASGFGNAVMGQPLPSNVFGDKGDGTAARNRANDFINFWNSEHSDKKIANVGADGKFSQEQLDAIQGGSEIAATKMDKGGQSNIDREQATWFQNLKNPPPANNGGSMGFKTDA